jgi:NTP pyrophosphatase (non-canonical NTP hydrolase)
MDANEYQELAARTLIDAPGFEIDDQEFMQVWNALGLAGEAGEVVDLIKKWVMHRHVPDPELMKKELGDVAWYLAALCGKFGFTFSEVLETNITKLQERYPNGWSEDDSRNRKES